MSPVRFWEAPPRFASLLASVAQLVEHRIRNARVAGSNPVGGSMNVSYPIAGYKTTLLCVLVFLFVCLSGCRIDGSSISTMTSKQDDREKIIGNKDFVSVDTNGSNIPSTLRSHLDAIGQLSTGCTAAHIGKGLVLTAGHCISVSPRSSSNSCRLLGVVWGNRIGNPHITTSKCESILVRKYAADADYALLKVANPPSASIAPEFDVLGNSPQLTMLSFPRMRPMEWSGYCETIEYTDMSLKLKKFFHTCDSEGGSSGAPLVDAQTLRLVGVHAGGADEYNYAFFLHAMNDIKDLIDSAVLQ